MAELLINLANPTIRDELGRPAIALQPASGRRNGPGSGIEAYLLAKGPIIAKVPNYTLNDKVRERARTFFNMDPLPDAPNAARLWREVNEKINASGNGACCLGAEGLVYEGPLFVKQERLGQNAQPILLTKGRTMKRQTGHELHDKHEIGNAQDKRITWVARVLRLRKFADELPQIVNVLKGEMALFGPRPVLIRDVPRYTLEQFVNRSRFKEGMIPMSHTKRYRNTQEMIRNEEEMAPSLEKHPVITTLIRAPEAAAKILLGIVKNN